MLAIILYLISGFIFILWNYSWLNTITDLDGPTENERRLLLIDSLLWIVPLIAAILASV